MDNKRLIGTIIGVMAFLALIAGATLAWWTWQSSDADKTVVNLTVVNGSNQLSASLDMDSVNYSGLAPAINCSGRYSKMGTVTISYKNLTSATAAINATLSLVSITGTHTGEIDRSQIHWALSENPKETCTSAIITNGTGTLSGVTDGGQIYNGNLTLGSIPANTSNGSKTLYLYFWIDPDYNIENVGNSVVTDPMQDMKITVTWTGTITNEPPKPTLYSAVANHTIKTSPTSWGAIPTAEEAGVYKTTQDGTDIYYYRGAVNDNNVLYDNKCWKIVRTTTTGGVKMIYNGLPTTEGTVTRCGTDVTTSQTDGSSNVILDGTNTTYKFDSTSPYSPDYRKSTIKPLIDSWFTSNVDDSMLETTDFCIDLEVSSTSGSTTYYKPYKRWNARSSTGAPTLDCSGTNKYPNTGYVGLLTMDEVWLAGGINSNNTYYLYNSKAWWLLSPRHVSSSNAPVFCVFGGGYIDYSGSVTYTFGVRPVVSVAPDIKYTGTGMYNDPYVPSL